MGFWKSFKEMDKTFAWSFVGAIIGAMGFAFGFVVWFWPQAHPDLAIDIISKASVFSVGEKVSKLHVMYDGKDVAESKLSITCYVIRFRNRGNLGVRLDDFDPNALPNIRFDSAKIIQHEILDGSTNYLKDWKLNHVNLFLEETKSDNVIVGLSFPPKLIESGEYVTAKIIVLHPDSEEPTFTIGGKIAGAPEIHLAKPEKEHRYQFLELISLAGSVATFLVLVLFGILMFKLQDSKFRLLLAKELLDLREEKNELEKQKRSKLSSAASGMVSNVQSPEE